MLWVWLTVAGTLVFFALVVVLALCKIAAAAAEEARRALEDERWAITPPARTPADEELSTVRQLARLRSNR
jgi:hypothetical protein